MKQLKTLIAFVVMAAAVLAVMFAGGGASPKIIGDNVVALQPGTALYIIDMALNSKQGYQIFANPEFPGANMWVGVIKENGVGFILTGGNLSTVIDTIHKCGGNLTNCNTASDMIKWATNNGWKLIPASEVSVAFKTIIKGAIASRVASSALYETSFVFVPAASFDKVNEYTSWKNSGWH